MRLLVISDSHRQGSVVDRIIRSQPDAKEVFFLGDVIADIEDFTYEYTDRNFHIVSGNCDMFSSYPSTDIAKVGGHNILFTHGHTLFVKNSLSVIKERAIAAGCDIVLYGHTHIADIKYENGLYIVNPGSCTQSRNGRNSYAVIDITQGGVLPIIINI